MSARQPTGRVVSVSNEKTFTDPVFNYWAHFEWMWDELSFTVPYEADWRRTERIVQEEVRRRDFKSREQGERALARVAERFVLAQADIEPATYVRAERCWIEITARFVTHVRTARVFKDAMTRAVLERFVVEQIPTAYPTFAIVPARPPQAPGTEPARTRRPIAGPR